MSRKILAYLSAPVAVALLVMAGACGGTDSEEEPPKGQLFATDPFGLEPGLAIVEMTHQGEGDFTVNLLSAMQEETVTTPEAIEFSEDQNGGSHTELAAALVNDTGPGKFSRAAHIPVGGKHLLEVKADGPWTVKVEQPHPTSAPRTTSFNGERTTATPFFELSSGVKTVTMRDYGGEGFSFSLLDKYGSSAKSSKLDEGKSEAGSGWMAAWTTVDIPEEGIYLLNIKSDGLWSIEITDGEEPVGVTQPTDIKLFGVVPLSLVIGVLVVPVVMGIIIYLGIRRSRVRG